jgi:hypothetical protein
MTLLAKKRKNSLFYEEKCLVGLTPVHKKQCCGKKEERRDQLELE